VNGTGIWLATQLRQLVDSYDRLGSFRRWFVVFAIISIVYLATANYGPVVFIDAAAAFHPAWHVIHHGHLFVDDGSLRIFEFVDGRDGHLFSNRTPGLIAFAIPFYGLLGGGRDVPSAVPAAVAACIASAGAVASMALVLEHLVPRRVALSASLLLGFGTSLWSVAAADLFPHGPDVLWLSLAMLALVNKREWLAGIMFALAITTRPQLAIVALILGVAIGASQRSPRAIIALGVPSTLGLLALMSYNRFFFGSFNLRGGYQPYVNGAFTGKLQGTWLDYVYNVIGTFVSGPRGLLVLTPALIVLVPGLRVGWRESPTWARTAALAGLGYMLIQWMAQSGHDGFLGGYLFYSYRYTIEPLFLCVPLLVSAYTQWVAVRRPRRLIFNIASALSVWIHGVGAIVYSINDNMPFHTWLAWSPAATVIATSNVAAVTSLALLAPVFVLPFAMTRPDSPSAAQERAATAREGE
jgi:hypothetical protein